MCIRDRAGAGAQDLKVFFGGSADAPLLVQLNDTDEAAGRGPAAGASGAAAAPHLGYVVRRTPSSEMSQEEREAAAADTALYDAAAKKAAAAWKNGFKRALPVPPPGLQWSLGAERGEEEAAERLCELTATYDESGGTWAFTIGGTARGRRARRAGTPPCRRL